jgi:hypothetical protein
LTNRTLKTLNWQLNRNVKLHFCIFKKKWREYMIKYFVTCARSIGLISNEILHFFLEISNIKRGPEVMTCTNIYSQQCTYAPCHFNLCFCQCHMSKSHDLPHNHVHLSFFSLLSTNIKVLPKVFKLKLSPWFALLS